MPRWALILAYLAVPVRFLSSLYGICCFVRVSLYFLAKPKSIKNNCKNRLYMLKWSLDIKLCVYVCVCVCVCVRVKDWCTPSNIHCMCVTPYVITTQNAAVPCYSACQFPLKNYQV